MHQSFQPITSTSRTSAPVIDPETGRPWQEIGGYAPGLDLPHVLTFDSLISTAWHNYYHGQQDDAIRNDRYFAAAMRRDPQLTALIQERKMATASLKWHLEVEDERDPQQKAIRDGVTTILKQTPRLKTMFLYLLEAMWYGKYGAQLDYEWRLMPLPDPHNPGEKVMTRASVVRRHVPLEGDKIGYHHDGTPYVLVHGGKASTIPQAEIGMSSAGRMLSLTGTWRRKFLLHQHEIIDAPYNDAAAGSAIYGVGIRHHLFWLAWLKKELVSNILDYCERQGLGLRVWYYQGGNPTSKAEVESAASLQTDRTNVIVPRFPNQVGKSSEGVEFVDTGSSGAQLLVQILDHWDKDIERYVIGQSLSGGVEGAGLGSEGVAGMHAETKHRLVSFDADNLAESNTADWVKPVLRWTYPSFADMPLNFVFDTNTPDPANKIDAVVKLYGVGVKFEENSVRQLTGMPAPNEGDVEISMAATAAAQQQMQPQPGAPGAMPGGPPAGGDPSAEGGEQPPADNEPTEQDYQELLAQMGVA
jgi:phage gp29-like protein